MEHQAGWAALRAAEAPADRAIFAPAHAASPSGETFEGLARTCYLEYEYSQAIELWERAYAAYRDGGDALGSVRLARTLGGMYGQLVGDLAVCAGWISRANSLVAGSPGSPKLGWMALTRGLFEGDRDAKNALFRDADRVLRPGQPRPPAEPGCHLAERRKRQWSFNGTDPRRAPARQHDEGLRPVLDRLPAAGRCWLCPGR